MHATELVLLGVLLAVGGFLVLAYRTGVPYPILLVLGGCGLGWLPGVPDFEIDPEIVLIGVLPPLLYSAAFFSSLRDLRANIRPIAFLAIGLVAATTVVVAVVAHELVHGMSWPAAFVLGAIVSPTDPLAASEIARRLGAPRRYSTVVEGESLINDSTALIAYKYAVAAVTAGTFSLFDALGRFAVNATVGVAIGLAVGLVIARVRSRIDDPPTEIAISLMTPYFAYLPAEAMGVSAVLAAVSAGIYLGWRAPLLVTPATRIQAYAVWEILVFVLNALVFTLLGLQLPAIIHGISGEPVGRLIGEAVLVSAVVMGVRIAWVFPFSRIRTKGFRVPTVVAWSGMRGAVSLAAALALPPFPQRDLIVFLTYAVIFSTLVFQGLSLPVLIRVLDVRDDGKDELKENKARLLAARKAIERIDELLGEDWVLADTAERMRGVYNFRVQRFTARFDDRDDGAIDVRSRNYQRLRRELLEAERAEIVRLRNVGRISDQVMRRIERDLDLEDARLEI